MVDLNVVNVITIGLIAVAAIVAARMAIKATGVGTGLV